MLAVVEELDLDDGGVAGDIDDRKPVRPALPLVVGLRLSLLDTADPGIDGELAERTVGDAVYLELRVEPGPHGLGVLFVEGTMHVRGLDERLDLLAIDVRPGRDERLSRCHREKTR